MKLPRRKYASGNPELDERIAAMVAETGEERHADLIAEIVSTGLRLGRDQASRLDVKIVNAAIKEMRYAFKVFAPYRDKKKVSVFGSARTKPGHPDYTQALEFGKEVAERGWMVVTGAGPGSMEAANAGAGKAQSFGVNIRLPFEAEPNAFIAEDPKLINFKYFFTRKLMFIKEASAFVLLPGGFGTMDETFELLTLMQTGKSDLHPVVLLDSPGGDFWERWEKLAVETLLEPGYVSKEDFSLFKRTDSIDEAIKEIEGFYRNYDSMRYVRNKLVLRVKRSLSAAALVALGEEFSDVITPPPTEVEPSRGEIADNDALDLKRIAIDFDRTHFGRLRHLINRLNDY